MIFSCVLWKTLDEQYGSITRKLPLMWVKLPDLSTNLKKRIYSIHGNQGFVCTVVHHALLRASSTHHGSSSITRPQLKSVPSLSPDLPSIWMMRPESNRSGDKESIHTWWLRICVRSSPACTNKSNLNLHDLVRSQNHNWSQFWGLYISSSYTNHC